MTCRVASVILLAGIGICRASVLDDALKYSTKNTERLDGDLLRLAAIPSISSLPEHANDIVAASEWLVGKLKASGLEVKLPVYKPLNLHSHALSCSTDVISHEQAVMGPL